MDTVHEWELPSTDGVAMQLLRDASSEGDELARGTLAWINKTRMGHMAPKGPPTTIQISKTDRAYLATVSQATGLPRRIIVMAAMKEWVERHCPVGTVSGDYLARMDSTTPTTKEII